MVHTLEKLFSGGVRHVLNIAHTVSWFCICTKHFGSRENGGQTVRGEKASE